MVVENMAGASGLVAHQSVARAAPDGYTLLFTNTSGSRPALAFFGVALHRRFVCATNARVPLGTSATANR